VELPDIQEAEMTSSRESGQVTGTKGEDYDT
jgi:hypothetical protein